MTPLRFATFALALASAAACGGADASPADDNASVLPDGTVTPVAVARVQARPAAATITGTGVVAGKEEVTLAFKTGGIIQRIAVDDGDAVRAGQLLAELQPPEIAAEAAKAREALGKAERDVARAQTLYQDSVATLAQFQDATTALEVARANVRIAEFNRRHTQIVAPANGVVMRRLAEPHQTISVGTPILLFRAASEGFVVHVGLPDREVARVRPGDAATVHLDTGLAQPLAGIVSRIAAAASPGTGTYAVEITLRNTRDVTLTSGLVARVEVTPRRTRMLPSVPIEAVFAADGDSASIWVVAPNDSVVSRRTVRVAYIGSDYAAVAAGLAFGEQVVTEGATYLRDGQRIRVPLPLPAAASRK